jgi:hypothetical protein
MEEITQLCSLQLPPFLAVEWDYPDIHHQEDTPVMRALATSNMGKELK